MKKKANKKVLYTIGFIAMAVVFVACSNEPIVIGETAPKGLFDTLLVYPISWLIDKVFAVTGNGGLAIMLATVIISIIVSPLEVFSQVETKKQQDIQPQIKELQEKYPDKNDKVQQQKMMIAQQKLYEENGMSMMGMCLPLILMIFIQMPILTSMFGAVRRLQILNNSSFNLFGITYNYGQMDPGIPAIPVIGPYLRLFIFAALLAMFASQFFSMPKGQRNPRENQQAMQMYLMNAMMILIFWNQPIALAIYWIVSNLVRLVLRFTVVNRISKSQHEKFLAKKREEKAKRYR